MKANRRKYFRVRGFTMVELLISIAIMMAMTGVLFIRYPETVKRLTLANVTYMTSLLVRESQVRGSAVDSNDGTIGGYGVYFDLANPGKVILFADFVDDLIISPYQIIVGDGLYQKSIDPTFDETKTTVTFPSGFIVAKVCVGTGFPFICNTDNNPHINTLTVSVSRPDPRLNIYINDSKNNLYSSGCIELHSKLAPASGHVRSVQVFNSGIIRTATTKCDNS